MVKKGEDANRTPKFQDLLSLSVYVKQQDLTKVNKVLQFVCEQVETLVVFGFVLVRPCQKGCRCTPNAVEPTPYTGTALKMNKCLL